MQLSRALLVAAAAAQVAVARDSIDVGGSSGQVDANFMTFTHLHNDVPAFKDLAGSVYKNVPPHLVGKILSTPDSLLHMGFDAVFHCPAGRPTPCDAYIFVYECSPCVSLKGALPGLLNGDGWERSRCAPHFTTGSGSGKTHRMTAYKKAVASGTTETVTMPNDVEYVSFAISHDPSVDCSALHTQGECEDVALEGECEWKLGAGQCQLAKCVGFGPGRGCADNGCIADDLPGMPMTR